MLKVVKQWLNVLRCGTAAEIIKKWQLKLGKTSKTVVKRIRIPGNISEMSVQS